MNQKEEDEDATDVVVTLINEAAQFTDEAGEIIAKKAVEDAAQNPFLEL